MNQLETAGALPATWLPFADKGSSEPLRSSKACAGDDLPGERSGQVEAAASPLYVSPPPMPWPRVFPGL